MKGWWRTWVWRQEMLWMTLRTVLRGISLLQSHCNHSSMGKVIAGSCFFDHEHKLLGYKLSIQTCKMIGLSSSPAFIFYYLFVLFPTSLASAVFWTSLLEIILLNCLRYVFVLSGSWHCQNWHSNIHRRDKGIRRTHEIIFSTNDKPKLLTEVRLRTPIHVLCGLGFRWMTFHIT